MRVTLDVEFQIRLRTNQMQEKNSPDVKGLKKLECPRGTKPEEEMQNLGKPGVPRARRLGRESMLCTGRPGGQRAPAGEGPSPRWGLEGIE